MITPAKPQTPTRIAHTPDLWRHYVAALAGIAIAALARWLLGKAVGDLPTYVMFYPVVFVAAILGGTTLGLVTMGLSLLTANLLFMEPFGKLGPATIGQAVGMILFIAVNTAISILAGRLRTKSEALRESEAQREIAHEAAHIGAFEWNIQTGVNSWTPELERMHGLQPGEFGGTDAAWEQLVHPEDRPKALDTIDRAFKTFQPEEGEWRVIWPDGTVHWVVARFQAFKDHTTKPLRLVGVNIDITDRKQAEDRVRQSEERFRTMADAIPQPAWIARPDGYIFWLNRRTYDYTGATPEQLEGWAWQSFHDPQVLPKVLERWRWSLDHGEPFDMEFPLRGADGRFRPFLTRVMPVKDPGGKVQLWFGTHTDISQQKQNEAEIIALRDRIAADLAGMNRLQALSTRLVREDDLQTLLESILDAAIILTGADKGHIHLFDPESGKLGMRAQRGFTPGFMEYTRHIRPGVLASGLAIQKHERVSVKDIKTSPLYRPDRRALDLLINAGMRAVVCTPLLTRTDQLVGTLSILFAIPHELPERDLRLLDLLARQAADYLERTLAEQALRTAREELARVNADLEKKVEERTKRLREAMLELEQMSYGMVHDMRAPLRAMQSFAQMLQEECGECRRPPAADYLVRIREASNRLDGLVTDALNYNKLVREAPPIAPVELGQLLRGILQTYPAFQSPAADVSVEFEKLLVLGNESLLTQCFSNLLDNAVKFVTPGVHPRIRIWPETGREPNVVSVCILDNGIGIPRDAQDKIFRMFQRMHHESEYPGRGIGLTIVRKAVERMNGRIYVHSRPGYGSRFCIELKTPQRSPEQHALHDADQGAPPRF